MPKIKDGYTDGTHSIGVCSGSNVFTLFALHFQDSSYHAVVATPNSVGVIDDDWRADTLSDDGNYLSNL